MHYACLSALRSPRLATHSPFSVSSPSVRSYRTCKPRENPSFDVEGCLPRVVVIGAGAAGTMAAIFAASSGAECLLLERTPDGGRKILISGGGRCNILPAADDAASRFVTDSSPNTLRKMLR